MMKKIGILTFHRSINYGAFMQGYSLSRQLQRRFPEAKVEMIDYTSAIMENIYKPHLTLSSIRHPIAALLKNKQRKKFHQSLNSLPLSQKRMCSDGNTEEVLSAYQDDYDVFVVGSDAVWNWCKRGFPNPYLMNFKKDVVKMSYAASAFGMGGEYVGEREKEYFKNSLQGFSFIGVRDTYTSELVKEICPSCDPTFTCDPTVFLDISDVYSKIGLTREEFREHIYTKFKIPKEKKLIGLMGAPSALIDRIKLEYGNEYVLVGLYHFTKGADVQIVDVNPFEWAAIFGLFDLTITSYFHGTLLSLRNDTPVINVDFGEFSKKYEGKIHDVMRRMELLECHFNDRKDIDAMMEQVKAVVSKRDEYSEKIRTNLGKLEKSSTVFFEKMEELIK